MCDQIEPNRVNERDLIFGRRSCLKHLRACEKMTHFCVQRLIAPRNEVASERKCNLQHEKGTIGPRIWSFALVFLKSFSCRPSRKTSLHLLCSDYCARKFRLQLEMIYRARCDQKKLLWNGHSTFESLIRIEKWKWLFLDASFSFRS